MRQTFSSSIGGGIRAGLSFGALGLKGVVDGTLRGAVSGFIGGMGNGLLSIVTAPLGALLGGITGLATGIVRGAVRGIFSLFEVGVNVVHQLARGAIVLGAEMERVATSFEVMTGSAKEGNRVLTDLRDLAIKSPFTFGQLSKPTQTLLGFGIASKDVIAIISRLGDVAAGDAEKLGRLTLAFGQVNTAGRFMGTELRQFAEAGVGANDFAQTMGITSARFREMMSLGQIGPDVVYRTLIRLTNQGGRFAGMSKAISKTVGGAYNALSETIELALGKAGLAFFKNSGLANGISSLAGRVRELIPAFEAFGAKVGRVMEPIVRNFSEIFNLGSKIGGIVISGLFPKMSQAKNGNDLLSKTLLGAAFALEKAAGLLVLRIEQFRRNLVAYWNTGDTLWEEHIQPGLDLQRMGAGGKASPELQGGIAGLRKSEMNEAQKNLTDVQRQIREYQNLINANDPDKAVNAIDRNWRRLRNNQRMSQINILKLDLKDGQYALKQAEKAWKEAEAKLGKDKPRDALGKAIAKLKAMDPWDRAEKVIDFNKFLDSFTEGKMKGFSLVGKLGDGIRGMVGVVKAFASLGEVIASIDVPNSMNPKLDKFIKDLEGKIGKGVTPFEELTEKANLLTNYTNKGISDLYKFGPVDPSEIADKKKWFSDLQEAGMYELVKDKLNKKSEISLPGSDAVGTGESQNVVNRSLVISSQTRNVQEEVRDILQEMKDDAATYYKERKDAEAAIEKFLKENPTVRIVKKPT